MTTEEILQEMKSAWMNNQTAADMFGFRVGSAWEDTYSKVSVLGLILWVTAYVYSLVGKSLDDWKSEVNATADATRYGTEAWWRKMVLGWQYGDTVTEIDGKMGYASEDESKRLVKAVSVVSIGRTLNIRVAKAGSSGLAKLSNDEVTALQSYVSAISPLGVRADVVSGDAGVLTVSGVVRYSGQVSLPKVREAVMAALTRVCSELEFGGRLYKSVLVHSLMGVEGVQSVDVTVVINGTEFTDWVEPASGYVTIGTDNLNYEAR